jgi:hypothetical protein
MRRRSALQSLPLRVAPIALRGDDGLVRVQLWLGRGRPMQQVSLTAKVGAHSVNSGAAGPVVGPWTAVLDLPDGPIEVTASCRSGAREWTASARLETPAGGRFAPAVQGEAGALTWNRSAWGAASASPIDAADQNV